MLPDFAHARIDPLSDDAGHGSSCRAGAKPCIRTNPRRRDEHRDELLQAIALRPDIREMVRNPVMLTALAVVHWNERRLPEQRADLYESIITWLSRSREQRPGRPSAERTVALLGKLALAMQDHPEGRQTQVAQEWAADALADRFADQPDPQEAAAAFLHDEELDSGIVVGRGRDLRFWHLTFQEYLAAKTIAGMREAKQAQLLTGPRPAAVPARMARGRPAAGRHPVRPRRGPRGRPGRSDPGRPVRRAGAAGSSSLRLADQASCVGLLGAIRRDLSPYGYVPADPRYAQLMQNVMAMFDPEGSRAVPLPTRVAAAEALGRAGDPRPGVGLRSDRRGLPDILWCDVPGGTLQMGSAKGDKDAEENEYGPDGQPLPVEIQPFRWPPTRSPTPSSARLSTAMGTRIASTGPRRAGRGKKRTKRIKPEYWDDARWNIDNHPVVGVSWYEAVAWCRWLTQRLRAVGELAEDQQIRLPTEAEWEWAARGPDGCDFRGATIGRRASATARTPNIGHTTAVGLFPAGASRWLAERTGTLCCDLAGNVWEWCATKWRDSYAKPADESPEGDASRMLRGGASTTSPSTSVAFAARYDPDWSWPRAGVFVAPSNSPFFGY